MPISTVFMEAQVSYGFIVIYFSVVLCINEYFFAGASDNGVSVAVALEVLEVLSRRTTATTHPVIFLFNGAEEKGMLVL